MVANNAKVNSIGWLNVHKEEGMTSFEVLRKLKRKFSFKKVGHYGTLDPLASGVLPIALGEATKTINYITNNYKKYSFTNDNKRLQMKVNNKLPIKQWLGL